MTQHRQEELPHGQGPAGSSPDEGGSVYRMRVLLDQSCAALDAATLSRLNSSRHRALDRRYQQRPRVLLPFATLASGCALLLVLAVLHKPLVPMPGAAPEPSLADINLLSTQEELAFYEDFEFIQWLADSESGF